MHFLSRTSIKVALLIVSLTFVSGVFMPADAQLKRRSIKKNNRNISKYRGSSNSFTRTNRYSYVGVTLNALNYFGSGELPLKVSFVLFYY